MAIFNSYVSLPEGNELTSIIDIFECGWILFPQRYKLGMKWDKHDWFVEIDALLFILTPLWGVIILSQVG